MKDLELVNGLLKNNKKAINYIYEHFFNRVKYYVQNRGGNLDDAKEVFQEALIVIYKKSKEGDILELKTQFFPYLMGICKYIWLNFHTNKSNSTIYEDPLKLKDGSVKKTIVEQERYNIYESNFKKLDKSSQGILELFFNKTIATDAQIADDLQIKKDKPEKQLKKIIQEDTRFISLSSAESTTKQYLEYEKDMYDFFDQREEVSKLRAALQDAENSFFNVVVVKPKKKRKKISVNPLIWKVLVGILLLLIFYFIYSNYIQNDNEELRLSDQRLETKESVEDTSSQKIEVPNDEDEIQQDSLVEEKEVVPVENVSIKNYKQNLALEAILTSSSQNPQSIELSSPNKRQVFRRKRGKILFSLKGKTSEKSQLRLEIYDNKPRSFEKGFKTLTLGLSPTEIAENDYKISSSANIPLERGLYYFVIKDAETDTLVYVNKFEVK